MTPAEMMVNFWRYRRVADKIVVRDAVAARAAASESDGFKEWQASMMPMTQEIDPPESVMKKMGRTVGPVVRLEDLEDE